MKSLLQQINESSNEETFSEPKLSASFVKKYLQDIDDVWANIYKPLNTSSLDAVEKRLNWLWDEDVYDYVCWQDANNKNYAPYIEYGYVVSASDIANRFGYDADDVKFDLDRWRGGWLPLTNKGNNDLYFWEKMANTSRGPFGFSVPERIEGIEKAFKSLRK